MLRLQIHLIHLLIYFKFVASVSDGYASFKSVKCSASEEFAYRNFSCFAKSFSRTMSTINIDISLKNPLDEFYLDSTLLFKYGTIYRQVISSPKYEWCENVNATAQSNILMYQLLKVLKDGDHSDNKFVHACPYTNFYMKNFTFTPSSMLSVFATGDYKMNLFYTDKASKSIVNISIVASFKSSNRDTFG